MKGCALGILLPLGLLALAIIFVEAVAWSYGLPGCVVCFGG